MILATASQTLARRDAKDSNCKDIKLENVDISFGTKKLLNGAEMTMANGHRYGLVGRNGIGKTTLLKMISCGQLVIPANITLLSVEQEVEGDDTPVIDSVLSADTRREALISKKEELQEQINSVDLSDEQKTELLSALNEVYAEIAASQFDKAPAKASTILFGLGFKPDEQRRPTKSNLCSHLCVILSFSENSLVDGG